ncbi:uncharacterized protein PV09_00514 [Verruconis gallopava]|uniref:Transcription factor domain-containing protein n=1 Tax=Verruconis gallopava TaxID=253628 RepID=A0A0D1Y0I7_9PEZI|nr:uncharacterized protein PV09_00514 [Verruconis gallopava]KIW08546.1 hypothetical protein PV09_00514 [Verruconis gallopava]
MLGLSFTEDFRQAVSMIFNLSPYLLADAYDIVTKRLDAGCSQNSDPENMDFALGSSCLQTFSQLSSSSISRWEEAALCAMLGQLLLAYTAMSPLGTSTRHVTRATLLAIRDWYPAMLEHPRLHTLLITLVCVDTIDCLLRRDLPILRLPTLSRPSCDRLAGVCTSLLPLLYDLCECSYRMRVEVLPTKISRGSQDEHDPYSDVEQGIHDWTPSTPPGFWADYTAQEQKAMFVQARTYRLAALLIIHRLRFPLGIQGTAARSLASAILDDIAELKSWPPDGATGLGLDFPLLVAAVEMPQRGVELFGSFDRLRFRKRHLDRIEDFVRTLHEARGNQYSGSWLDFVEDHFVGDLLP